MKLEDVQFENANRRSCPGEKRPLISHAALRVSRASRRTVTCREAGFRSDQNCSFLRTQIQVAETPLRDDYPAERNESSRSIVVREVCLCTAPLRVGRADSVSYSSRKRLLNVLRANLGLLWLAGRNISENVRTALHLRSSGIGDRHIEKRFNLEEQAQTIQRVESQILQWCLQRKFTHLRSVQAC